MMSTDARDQALGRLGEVRERFAARLRLRLAELGELVEAAQRQASRGQLAEAVGAAHRLAGTAGSYGYVEVGEAAAGLERALQRIAGGEDEWAAALDALARARRRGE